MTSFTGKLLSAAFGAALALSSVLGGSAPARAEFPEKPITLVVWSGAGGPLDIYGRKLSELLSKEAGWASKVENRPGGSGAVGLSYLMTQPADGQTWVILTGTLTFGIAQGLIPFKVDDLRFVRAMQGEPSSLAVLKESPLKSTADFVAALKEKPRGLKVGGHAPGGFHRYMLYRLMSLAGTESGWIPHDAAGKVPLSLLGGHLDVAMMTPSSGLSQVKAGTVRLLAISTAKRSEFHPDVPTFREQGYDIVDYIWRGVAVKAGTPDEVVAKIQAALDKVEASDAWKAFMKVQGQENPGLKDAAFRDYVAGQIESQRAFLEKEGFIGKSN